MMWSISDVCSDRRSLSAFFNLFFFNPLFLQAETLKHSSVDTRRLIRSARLVQRMRNAALEGSWVELDILLQSEDVAAIVGGINVSTNGEEEGEEEGEEGEAGKEEASLHKDSRSGMLVFLKHAVELVVARCLHEKNRHRKSDPRQKKIQGSSSSSNNSNNNNSSGGHRQVVSQWKSLVHRLMMTNKKTNHVHALTGWLRGKATTTCRYN